MSSGYELPQLLFGNVFILTSLLKDSFAGSSIPGWQFFFFQHFDISSYSLLAWKVSAKKYDSL